MKRILFLLLPCLLLWGACHHQVDPLPEPDHVGVHQLNIGPDSPLFYQDDSCRAYPLQNCNLPCPEEWDDDLVYDIRFNPKDAREMVYAFRDFPGITYRLYKLNVKTREQSFLVDEVVGLGGWSVKDWVVFDRHHLGLWKIKSNGDSLQALSVPSGVDDLFLSPGWNQSGTQILVDHPQNNMKILNEAGEMLDSLPCRGKPYVVSPNWKYRSQNQDDFFGYQDLATGVFYPLRTAIYGFKGAAWGGDNRTLVALGIEEQTRQFAVYVFDVETKSERILYRPACWNYSYHFPQISPDGQWLVLKKLQTDLKPGTEVTRLRDRRMAFIYLDTGEEYVAEFHP
jgi:hypothetical protein